MTKLLLATLLFAAPARAEESELMKDVDMRREMEKVESANLENAAAAAGSEAAKGLKFIRALVASGQAGLEGARVDLEALLRDPEELRRQLRGEDGDPVDTVDLHHEALAMAGQLLATKSEQFLVKIASVPLGVPEEDRAKLLNLRTGYSSRNRESDLRRAASDAQAARKRLGVVELTPKMVDAVSSIESCLAEIANSAAQARQAVATLEANPRRADAFSGPRESLLARAKGLEDDAKDLGREIELFKSYLLLLKADRQISGVPSK